ncbi:MAG TPA: type I DNA topoisomerase [Chloroflexi bacterium]|nr:type I DNA topoisomerase [Chloroflexota bacterium]HBY07763.1 type I DNA topoisomerase [Chloroflexota bacterium]
MEILFRLGADGELRGIMEAYCMKCKVKREIKEAQAVFTATGTPATQGSCPECGTKLFRMGRTEAHDGLTPPEVASRKRAKQVNRSGKLVIVESPAKARTVGRFLGKGYTVKASVGHVRDLLRSKLSVDVDDNFKPQYRVPNEKRPVVKDLKALAEKSEEVYLATDLDREGEAIAWHLMESAEIDPARTKRVVFHEITRPAIEDAFSHPRELNMDLVDAQQGRRVLDRLVGYSISPLLWRKVRGRLSAGRVQSVALRLIVEREREIEAFTSEEYWTIKAELLGEGSKVAFIAKLHRIDAQEPALNQESDVTPILADMEKAKYKVHKVKKGERRRKPQAPFTTSTLQQEASRRLGFTARKTMRIAQQLYEGIDVSGRGSTGLITYMRTDSTHVSEIAQKEAKEYILAQHGQKFLPPQTREYKTKTKGAQEAHEAIRPTSVSRTPKSIKAQLARDQYRLYTLIWQRFVASQMASAIYDTISVDVVGKSNAHKYLLRASGSTIRFPGFLMVYADVKQNNDNDGEDENGDTPVPTDLTVDQLLALLRLIPEQHFTQPPPRFSEASLVKTLEENGIGRPSTYAPTLTTLQTRGYIVRDGRRLFPTETGLIVNDLVTEYFPNIVDVNFTANMEEQLDQVASGNQSWVEVVGEFYGPFAEQVQHANKAMPEVKTEPEAAGRDCPECGQPLVIRWGRHGKFIGCSNFPTCRYTEPWLETIGVNCPKCNGDLVERKTRKNRTFFGCVNYPECDFTSWKKPLPTPCPSCGGLLVVASKQFASCTHCEEQIPLELVVSEETIESV